MSKKARHPRRLSRIAPARGRAKPTRPRRTRERASVAPMPLTVAAPRVEPELAPASSPAVTLRSPPSTLPVPTLAAVPSAKRGLWLSSPWILVVLAAIVFALFVWSVADLEENRGVAVAALSTVQNGAGGMESAWN